MFKALLLILDLDGYRSLWCKFHDRSSLSYSEHRWVSDNWTLTMWQMVKRVRLGKAWRLRAAWYHNDWDTMYEMLLEWHQIEDPEAIGFY